MHFQHTIKHAYVDYNYRHFLGRQVGLNEEQESTNIVKTEEKVSTQTIKKTLTSSGSVASKTTEKVALSTSKYFDSFYECK